MLKLIKIALKSDPPSPSNGNASVWPKTRGSPSARPRFRNYVGPDRILWESEFPRSTSTYPETARMIDLIGTLPRTLSILMIEHDMNVVFSVADRITVLYYGKVLATGAPADIQADARVREVYLGTAH